MNQVMEEAGEIESLLTAQGWKSVEVIKSLESEKDANYLFKSNETFFVAKIFHAGTHASDITLMVDAMKLARDRNIRVPCPGAIVCVRIRDTEHFMMVYELIPGDVLDGKLENGTSWEISVKVAALLGQLCECFSSKYQSSKTFREEGICEWNFYNFSKVVSAGEFEFISPEIVSQWEQGVRSLPTQLCHYDCNLDNILILSTNDPHGIGIVDFGDVDVGPRIADLSIFLTYIIGKRLCCDCPPTFQDLVKWVKEQVSEFQSEISIPLSREEEKAIPILVLMRALMSVCIQTKNMRVNPMNSLYLSKSIASNKKLIDFILSVKLNVWQQLFSSSK